MVTRIIVADDQLLVRVGLAAILSHEPEFEVVGQFPDGRSALDGARRLNPDVALLDVRMPELDGLEVPRAITSSGLRTKVIIITTFDSDDHVRAAIASGASGFLLKDAGPDLLRLAVRAASLGGAMVSPAVAVRLMSAFGRSGSAPTATAVGIDMLSEREIEVVKALARGLSNAELAASLSISVGTVKAHLANVQSKLAVRNRVEIAGWAWAAGLMRD